MEILTSEIIKKETRLPLELVKVSDEFLEDIRVNGIKEPIEIRIRGDESQIVWDGLHRLKAAVLLNLRTVPVRFVLMRDAGQGG